MDKASDEAKNQNYEVVSLSGHFENWFLDYASYVILERAVPALEDGLKPVQRRILHSMKEMDDGRYHKVANIIGNTMKFHPHGDSAIGDALIHIGQKDLLIDTQGNWGNTLTGDSAAAPRYIEARLTPFALDTLFLSKTTQWIPSYDGRNKEPVTLPSKFPILLYHGVEGIAVGLSTKIMPHNFIELIDASIQTLRGKKPTIYPDFPTGGSADFSQYNDGLQGSRIKVRATIEIVDKNTLSIVQLPFGNTTSSLIDSILKANDKGKIKVKKVEDNTAEHVEILVHLPSNISPDQTIDALYAFTDCEQSISCYSCVVHEDKPKFIGVSEILAYNTQHTVHLLKWELQILLEENKEKWHFSSLEKLFIENRIYLRIEECETWEGILEAIRTGLEPFMDTLEREVTNEDITRLTEIRIKRISRFDAFKADEILKGLEEKRKELEYHLEHITEYAIDYFKGLKKKFSKGRERQTKIATFESIEATKVAIANERLYVNRAEGFIGTGLKKDELVCECSDIDDIIVFRKNGTMLVTKVEDKKFVGKDILHVDVFKKDNTRLIYNLIYEDGESRYTYQKRFFVKSITRDKEYSVAGGSKSAKIWHFSANPNGEAEVLDVMLKGQKTRKKLKFEIDFKDLGIKSRSAKGNIVSKFPLKSVEIKEEGISTLDPIKVWLNKDTLRLSLEESDTLLGAFQADDKIVEINAKGEYRTTGYELTTHFDTDQKLITKCDPDKVLSVIYWYPEKKSHYVKRFYCEVNTSIIPLLPKENCKVEWISDDEFPRVSLSFKSTSSGHQREDEEILVSDFIDPKGIKAIGNKLSSHSVKKIKALEPLPRSIDTTQEKSEDTSSEIAQENKNSSANNTDEDKGNIADLFGE